MCGIVAYIGDDKAGPILFDTLKRLEYRGYDSAGVAVISQGSVEVLKSSGRIVDLEKTYKSMGSMTLDRVWVSGLHLRPSPAANITPFKSITARMLNGYAHILL